MFNPSFFYSLIKSKDKGYDAVFQDVVDALGEEGFELSEEAIHQLVDCIMNSKVTDPESGNTIDTLEVMGEIHKAPICQVWGCQDR